MFQSNLGFVFKKTIGRVIENTILRYVLVEVNRNIAIPIALHEIEEALSHDQPEFFRRLLLQAHARLSGPGEPPAVAVMPPMWARDP